MNAGQRQIKLKRIVIDIEELINECWNTDDKNQLEKLLNLAEKIYLVGYDD